MAGSAVDTTEVDALTDAELITAVREGDNAAYGTLFDRHRAAAERLARQLVRGPDADDLVAESFTRVLVTLQQGKGPDESFRAYLLTAMRRFHIDRIRAGARVRSTGDEAELDRTVDWVDPAEMRFESGAAAQAFAALPERWQTVLWHLDVEGQKPAEVAPLLGMSANSVSALAYRAREGLRQSYLQQHLGADQRDACRGTTEKLGAYVRGGLAARDTAKVESHLDECARCTGLYLELREINGNLAAWLAPALLGAAASGYLTAGTTVGAVGAAAVLKGAAGVVTAPFRALGPAGGSAAAGVTVVAVAAGIAVATNGGSDPAPPRSPATQAAPAATSPTSTTGPEEPAPTTATPSPTPTPQRVSDRSGHDRPRRASSRACNDHTDAPTHTDPYHAGPARGRRCLGPPAGSAASGRPHHDQPVPGTRPGDAQVRRPRRNGLTRLRRLDLSRPDRAHRLHRRSRQAAVTAGHRVVPARVAEGERGPRGLVIFTPDRV